MIEELRELSELSDDGAETVLASDTRILGALHARDADRARRLMEVHLEITLGWWAERHARRSGSS